MTTKPATPAAVAPVVAAKTSVLQTWLPLITAVALMPLLAYGTMKYVVMPQMQRSLQTQAGATPDAPAVAGAGERHGKNGAREKVNVPMNKILVNVSGSMGSRYLMACVTVSGARPDLDKVVENNKAQLTDLAASLLSSKTIEDLEKPGARNTIRSELLAAFNTALGEGTIRELYLTEFAVQ